MTPIDKHKETFREEAYELLGELETSLLELEASPDNAELVGRVFRAMHTIKGSGAMFGFDDIAKFTHEIETVFDLVRNGKIPVTKELISLTLSARDQIREMLDAYSGSNTVNEAKSQEIVASFRKFVPVTGEEKAATERRGVLQYASAPAEEGLGGHEPQQENITYSVLFRPSHNVFMNGTNPLCLLAGLRALGECKVIAHLEDIPSLEDVNPEFCYTHWDIILTTRQGIDAIKDVFIFIADDGEVDIKVIDANKALDNENKTGYKRLGEILVDRGDIAHEDVQKALSNQKRLGDILVESGLVTGKQVQSALNDQKQQARELYTKRRGVDTSSSIRVPASKLDNFVDLVGELVIIQQRLSQTATGQNNPELLSIAEEVERLTVKLRDSAFSVRMLPMDTLFSKFKRLMHDLSKELGREVEMTTDGGETELDKTVIEQMNDPLVHIIRNSIDHGIEPPEIREAAGKPRKGTVRLSAAHSGSSVLIQIADDGKGLDPEAIRAKAVEKGLITDSADFSEKALFALIFLPGFSTAKTITSVSGRGVGMDVVKRTIDALRGSVEVHSKCGVGTTITIKLPLTLAIIEGLQVEVGDEHFVLPLSMVEECMELTREEVEKSHGWRITNIRGEMVPYIRLRERFMIPGEPSAIEQVVIARTDGRRVGFVVDNVIGEHQTVIKALGKVYQNARGISGATILGNGRVALILDIPQLAHAAESNVSPVGAVS
ncbi:MAG TPA: chemotaxis protein CheA [Candidatus Brocadiaceae bacterium]|nr:chemotaxis protein CheA [Candidatus Brocadiaceae bacterium]